MPRRSLKGSKAPAEEVYEMEDVVDYRVDDKGVERFFVKWKGYPSSENTWEPEANILEPSAAMKSKMIQLRAAANEAEKPAKTTKAVTKGRSKPAATTTTETSTSAAAAQQAAKTTPVPAVSASKAANESRGTKRKPPPPEASADREESSAELSHKGPEGKVAVWHMGRGPEESVEEYKVTLVWENGYQVSRSVSYVREKYPEALLDYLLSRVRFRK